MYSHQGQQRLHAASLSAVAVHAVLRPELGAGGRYVMYIRTHKGQALHKTRLPLCHWISRSLCRPMSRKGTTHEQDLRQEPLA